MGLYNTYDPKKLREPHRRAIARAGALCAAFHHNLALFGFPFTSELASPMDVADFIAGSTSIGQDGSYLLELAGSGRLQIFPYPEKGFPPQLGLPVATTCRPDPGKAIEIREVATVLLHTRGVLLLVGLGPRGLPDPVRRICERHLDVTGIGYSLETCCAMGAIAGSLHANLRLPDPTLLISHQGTSSASVCPTY